MLVDGQGPGKPSVATPRFFGAQDRESFLELDAGAGGKTRSWESWRRRFEDNPVAPARPVVAALADQTVVGRYVVLPHRISLLGKTYLAGHATEVLVAPEYRGGQLSAAMARAALQDCSSRGMEIVYGFPNTPAFSGNIHHLNFRPIVRLSQYFRRLSIRDQASRLGLGPAGAIVDWFFRFGLGAGLTMRKLCLGKITGATVSESADLPGDYPALWKSVQKEIVLCFSKDADYLRWRYGALGASSRYFAVHRSGELCGIGVTVQRGRLSYVAELMVRDSDVFLARQLLEAMARRHLTDGTRTLLFLGHDFGFFQRAFAGFHRRPAWDVVFIACPLGKALSDLVFEADNWNLTSGDTDLF